jgi:two-component sensor histidine kinase
LLGAVAITTDITDRMRAEEALAAQRRLLQAILEQAGDGIIVRDAEGRVSFVNAAARRHARIPPEGTPLDMAVAVWGETFDGEGNPLPVERWPVTSALHGEPGAAMELHRVGADGQPVVILSRATSVRSERGELLGAVVTGTDITTLKHAEHALRQRVADKEFLLREVHHRTKNNLTMLADVLFLQSEAVSSLEAKEALCEAYGRALAMAGLHDQLYQSMESGRIRLVEYLRKLVAGVEQLWPAGRFRLEAPNGEVHLDPDRAIHAGLVVNELLTNAVKHAFPDGQSGEIGVRLRALADQLELEVWDTGKGLPAGLDLGGAKTLGLRMVHILARKLEADVEIERAGGTRVKLRLPRGQRDFVPV